MPDIAFMTYMHNAENSMRRSIESVLNQQDVDLVYYLINNASTDKTWEIMCEYADRDHRIRLLQNENSLVRLPEYIKGIKDCEYFAVLDADDWYEPTFAREAIAFAKQEDLDIAAVSICQNRQEGKKYRKEDAPTILSCDEVKQHRRLISLYFTAMWGKVYKLSIVQTMDFSRFDILAKRNVFLGVDTIFSFSAVMRSRKVGIMDQVLIQYDVSPTSDSNQYNPNRLFIQECVVEMWFHMFVDMKKMEQIDCENIFAIIEKYYETMVIELNRIHEAETDTKRLLHDIKRLAEICQIHMWDRIHPAMAKEIKIVELLVIVMIEKMRGMEGDQEAISLFYECLKALDAVEIFKEIVK